jgi:sulfite reductase alpha subunit-like flavoprotein
MNDSSTAMLVCGSLPMGKDVVDVLEKWMSQTMSNEQSKKMVQEWEKKGKLIKELW